MHLIHVNQAKIRALKQIDLSPMLLPHLLPGLAHCLQGMPTLHTGGIPVIASLLVHIFDPLVLIPTPKSRQLFILRTVKLLQITVR